MGLPPSSSQRSSLPQVHPCWPPAASAASAARHVPPPCPPSSALPPHGFICTMLKHSTESSSLQSSHFSFHHLPSLQAAVNPLPDASADSCRPCRTTALHGVLALLCLSAITSKLDQLLPGPIARYLQRGRARQIWQCCSHARSA